jgi:hypothetical protein
MGKRVFSFTLEGTDSLANGVATIKANWETGMDGAKLVAW